MCLLGAQALPKVQDQRSRRLCFHGGRNECFAYGPTIDTEVEGTPPFRELDLISAYAVAMASMGTPDWTGMHDSTDLSEFRPGVLGIAYVRFRFPGWTRFPSLPIVAPNDYGLLYPLEGEAHATASEIAVARRQGAEIDILDGVIVPRRVTRFRQPSMLVIDELQRPPKSAPGSSLPWRMLKAAQFVQRTWPGIKGTSVYNTRTTDNIGPCEVTQRVAATTLSGLPALITGIIGIAPDL
jgi:hypothetical protein